MKISRYIEAIARRLVWGVCWFLPVQKNKVLASSYYGKGYGDNPKYIVNELLKDSSEHKLIWVVNNMELAKTLPDGVAPCINGSLKHIYHLTTAKVWIDNCRKPFFYKKKNQFYIQTWHGDIGLKKGEKDVEEHLGKAYVDMAMNDSKNIDIVTSSARWFTETTRRNFWYDGEIFECGYPRRDLFFNSKEDFVNEIKGRLGIDPGARILFYAPTFRKDQKSEDTDFSCYGLDWEEVLSSLKRRFGGEWVGMIRLHPNVSQFSSCLNLPSSSVDATQYPAMQELMLISDCMITDYSSSLFEFGEMMRPGFVFALDYDDYKKDRDVYFNLQKLPFPFASSNEALMGFINSFNEEVYLKEMNTFYKDTLGVVDTGTASKQIVERIKQEMKK